MDITINYISPQFTRRKNNFLKEHQSSIITMVEQGVSIKKISTEFNTDIQTLYRFLRICGIEPTLKNKRKQQERVNKIMNENINLLIVQKLPIKEIADKTNCTVIEIGNWIRDNSNKLKNLIRLNMFQSGMNVKEVAKECRISLERAFQLKKIYERDNLLEPQKKDSLTTCIQRDINNGLSTNELSKKYKLSHSSIYRYRKLAGISQETIFEKRKKQILRMAEEGLGIRDMAKELNLSEEAIKSIIKKYNLSSQIKTYKEKIEDRILEDSEKGIYIKDLARIYGYSERTICNKLKRARSRLAKNANN